MSKKTYKMGRLAVLLVLCVGLASVGLAADIYVDAASPGPTYDGSLANPFLTIQAGVDLAANQSSNVGPDIVNVAAGTYAAGALISDFADVTVLGAGAATTLVTGPESFGLANFIARNQSGAVVVTVDGFGCSGATYGIGTYPVDGVGAPLAGAINLNVNNCTITGSVGQHSRLRRGHGECDRLYGDRRRRQRREYQRCSCTWWCERCDADQHDGDR